MAAKGGDAEAFATLYALLDAAMPKSVRVTPDYLRSFLQNVTLEDLESSRAPVPPLRSRGRHRTTASPLVRGIGGASAALLRVIKGSVELGRTSSRIVVSVAAKVRIDLALLPYRARRDRTGESLALLRLALRAEEPRSMQCRTLFRRAAALARSAGQEDLALYIGYLQERQLG